MIKEATLAVSAGNSLSEEEMEKVVDQIMNGDCNDKQIAHLLTGLYEKGETVDELAGAARALRKHMTPIETYRSNVIDTCGTGGGNTGTFNISTAAAIVAASAGASVAKHGNRKSTSKTGSADVLNALGVNIECSIQTVQKCLNQLGICFCFAPIFHPSVRHVMKVRKKLPHPTLFNLLGPLCNPANSPFQVLGVGRGETRNLIASALAMLGTTRSLVVHGRDGLGEFSNSTVTDVTEVSGKQIVQTSLAPEDFGIPRSAAFGLKAADPKESAQMIRRVLDGKTGPARDVVVINAAAALWVSGLSENMLQATDRCLSAIDNGHAGEILNELIELTNKG